MRLCFHAFLLLVASLAAGGALAQTRGAVCSRAENFEGKETGASLAWAQRDLAYTFHAAGTADIPGDSELDAIDAAFQVWANATACGNMSLAPPAGTPTDLRFFRSSVRSERDLVGYNFLHPSANENLMIFRDSGWPHPLKVVALTTTTYAHLTGEILDADIEFNTEGHPFTISDANVQIDLMNTAVHEIGHYLGLGHPDEDTYPEIDPGCTSAATMCKKTTSGETTKRDLSCFDRDAIVFRYPATGSNGYCQQPACAVGFEGCGPCQPAQCDPWADCGFCALPSEIEQQPTVTTTGIDDGQGGCDCRTAPPAWLALLFMSLRVARSAADRARAWLARR